MNQFAHQLLEFFLNTGILMIQYNNSEWDYNLKRRRELHEYKDFPVK